jgi:hypothetical protein
MFDFDLQLFGGGGGGGGTPAEPIKTSAPGSSAAASIEQATAGSRQEIRNKMAKARGRSFTDKGASTGQSDVLGNIKKALLGE